MRCAVDSTCGRIFDIILYMKMHLAALLALASAFSARASWYWPFGSDDKAAKPRISELIEPASLLIDSAADLAADGKIEEAVEEYRKAMDELLRIEIENPDRAATAEFSTVRNKKAYVESAIDSLRLSQARDNAKAVTVTDTTELEKRYAQEQEDKAAAKAGRHPAPRGETPSAEADGHRAKARRAAELLAAKDYESAKAIVKEMLDERPNDAGALNIRAAVEAAEGRLDAAEATLVQLIRSNPRNHHGYYNLAKLTLKMRGEEGREAAKRYYENGREYCGGPLDLELEEALK